MLKKKTWLMAVMLLAITAARSQSNWSFVGPVSSNQLYGNGFETAQMSNVVTSPLAPGVVFSSSQFGGMWVSYTNGSAWESVDASPTGLSQGLAIAFKNANEILVGNFQNRGDFGDSNWSLSYSTRVSSYNFWTQSWVNYPTLPVGNLFCVIRDVAVHPTNQNIIYAATTIGLFRYNGTSWTLVVPNCNLESVVFTDNSTCFISGSDAAGGNYPNYSAPTGKKLVMVSDDPGNSIFYTFSPDLSSAITGDAASHTKICSGAGGIFTLTWTKDAGSTEHRYLNKITKSGSTFNVTSCYGPWTPSYSAGFGRMAIAYDAYNNSVWLGAVQLEKYNLSTSTFTQGFNSSHMSGGSVHSDIHCLHVDANNNLWVACDGGIGIGSLTTAVTSFSAKNNSLNVSMPFSFSGSEQEPTLYALGGQDIVNIDVYDEAAHKNRYTKSGGDFWENDGAFIYKFNDSLMIFDANNSPAGPPSSIEKTYVSLDKGYSTPYDFNPYVANSSGPFSPSSTELNFGNGRFQRTLQDPYRPGRIFQIGRFGTFGAAIEQYDFNSHKMVYKIGLGDWGPSMMDLSFSPRSKNVLYALSGSYTDISSNAYVPSKIFKYIGPDIDDCWKDHNGYTYPPNNLPQWLTLYPDYLNFHTVVTGANDFASSDLGKIFLKKIESSPRNPDIIYVAGLFGHPSDPATDHNFRTVKVMKYDGFTWTNYSYGIDEEAVVFSMIMDHYSNDALYLSTSKGVYYRDASMSNWDAYTTGLQNIPAVQMEINYNENTVRVGTFGYGIWKSPLRCPTSSSLGLGYIVNSGFYEANTIISSATHATAAGPNVLRATNAITLNPGFVAVPANNGTFFFGFIHGCSSKGTSPNLYRSVSVQEIMKDALEPSEVDNKFNLLPNPGFGIYQIENKLDENFDVDVLNMQGALIRSFKISDGQGRLNISDLSSGLYFFVCKSVSGYTKILKVIKN
jgi:hypothetical protein